MSPLLEITGTDNATITINNKSFILNNMDGKYILDCKAKEITKNGRKIYPVYHPVARVKDEIKINDLKNIKKGMK